MDVAYALAAAGRSTTSPSAPMTARRTRTGATAEPTIETAGKYAVIVTWPDKNRDDVDTYVRDPDGKIVYFNMREPGFMHLERDDRGEIGDVVNGVKVEQNVERVVFREVVTGEYAVVVHMYAKRIQEPTAVDIVLVKLKPHEEIVKRQRVLAKNGDEQTAFRFTIGPDGSIASTTDLPLEKRLTGGSGEEGHD